MSGTFRTQDPAIRDAIDGRAKRIIDGVCAAYGCTATLEVKRGYPAVYNNPALTEAFAGYVRTHTNVGVEEPPPTMGGEDFAYFAQRVPGVLVRLGIYNEGFGSIHSGHSPQFKVDEGAFPTGIATLVAFARGVGDGSLLPSA